MKLNLPLIRSLIILPGTGLVLAPGLTLFLGFEAGCGITFASTDMWQFWTALFFGAAGLFFMVWTITLFVGTGKGTPAPWEPPRNLVIRGPYRYVRNPMITGVIFVLLAETLFLQSWPLAVWTLIFVIGNSLYFPLVEERGLAKRFGDDYRVYSNNVPRRSRSNRSIHGFH